MNYAIIRTEGAYMINRKETEIGKTLASVCFPSYRAVINYLYIVASDKDIISEEGLSKLEQIALETFRFKLKIKKQKCSVGDCNER